MAKKGQAKNPPGDRKIGGGKAKPSSRTIPDRWAFIIGISEYKHAGINNLEFADRDAEKLYELIRKPSGGGYEKQRICKLINEQATSANFLKEFRKFLKQPARDDMVLIYIACHAAADKDRTDVQYLLTYDTDPKDISNGVKMREIKDSLKDYLHARQVVIIADTCHSAALGGGIGPRARSHAGDLNRYLKELKDAGDSVALLTSSEANESSLEDKRWGGGHGVFTHFLLEGLRGNADRNPKNGTVTVGELFEYVREKVKKATEGKQHPVIGTDQFDRGLPMAVIGNIADEEHLQLGRCLSQLGWLMDDRGRHESAIRQFETAIKLLNYSEKNCDEANLELAKSCWAIGDFQGVINACHQISNSKSSRANVDANLYLGLAHAKLKEQNNAVKYLKRFNEVCKDKPKTDWANNLIAKLESGGGKLWALLIGIGKYKLSRLNLPGPPNDLIAMHDILTEHYGVAKEQIVILKDDQATRENILASLVALAQLDVKPSDSVLVYFSGHAMQDSDNSEDAHLDDYLIPFGFSENDGAVRSVLASELNDLLNSIPSRQTTLIIDSHVTSHFMNMARSQGKYSTILATNPKQQAYESTVADGNSMGFFTQSLVEHVEKSKLTVSIGELFRAVSLAMSNSKFEQVPTLMSPDENEVFIASNSIQEELDDFDFSLRRNFVALESNSLRSRYQKIRQRKNGAFADLFESCGRAFIQNEDYISALEALQKAKEQNLEAGGEINLLLGISQLKTQNYVEAFATLTDYLNDKPDRAEYFRQQIQILSKLSSQHKTALVVGVDSYENEQLVDLLGAANDARELVEVLKEKCGFHSSDIKLLINEQATNSAITSAFREIVRTSRKGPALFYFAGYGSRNVTGSPTICPTDSRTGQLPHDLALRRMAEKAGANENNLITIIDSGWNAVRLPWGDSPESRFNSLPPLEEVSSRGLSPLKESYDKRFDLDHWQPNKRWVNVRRNSEETLAEQFQIGRITILPASAISILGREEREDDNSGETVVEAEFEHPTGKPTRQFHGAMTHALITTLNNGLGEQDSTRFTIQQLKTEMANKLKWLQPFFLCERIAEIVLSAPVQEQEVHNSIYSYFEREPARLAVELLKRLIENAGGIQPEAWLNLGIAHCAMGEIDQGLKALETSIEQFDVENLQDARYQLGRVLCQENRNLDLAITNLRKVLAEDPQNVKANYYLGQALLARTEQETLVEAEKALAFYITNEAPLGNRAAVEQFLVSQRKARRSPYDGGRDVAES